MDPRRRNLLAALTRRFMLEQLAAEGFVPGRDVEVDLVHADERSPGFAQLGIAVEELVLGRGDGSDDLERILARLVATRAEAVIFQTFSLTHRQFASTLAALEGRAIPAMFLDHRIVQRGGLVSLGVRNDFPDPAPVRSIARILRGESPGSIPVAQSTRTHFALNLRTARAMKLVVPQSVLLRADEVID